MFWPEQVLCFQLLWGRPPIETSYLWERKSQGGVLPISNSSSEIGLFNGFSGVEISYIKQIDTQNEKEWPLTPGWLGQMLWCCTNGGLYVKWGVWKGFQSKWFIVPWQFLGIVGVSGCSSVFFDILLFLFPCKWKPQQKLFLGYLLPITTLETDLCINTALMTLQCGSKYVSQVLKS